jgi:hypothetical protein
MKIIQISVNNYAIYGLGDDGKLYQVFYRNLEGADDVQYWKEIKIEQL